VEGDRTAIAMARGAHFHVSDMEEAKGGCDCRYAIKDYSATFVLIPDSTPKTAIIIRGAIHSIKRSEGLISFCALGVTLVCRVATSYG